MLADMMTLPIPVLEKILRPIIIYAALLMAFRLFGKRELAQLNPMDLTVLLLLSNTVQNSIIGEDNSVTGGLIGATTLFAVNWMLNALSYRSPRFAEILDGKPDRLIEHGKINQELVQKEKISQGDLLESIHRQGVETVQEVRLALLQPSGNIAVVPRDDPRIDELLERMIRLETLLQGPRSPASENSVKAEPRV